MQGLWATNDPMLQLPGFTVDVIKSYRKKLREHQIPDGKIETFCRLTKTQRSELEIFSADESTQEAKEKDLERVIKAMPLVSLTHRVWVEGETSITATDIISFEIVLTYDSITDEN